MSPVGRSIAIRGRNRKRDHDMGFIRQHIPFSCGFMQQF